MSWLALLVLLAAIAAVATGSVTILRRETIFFRRATTFHTSSVERTDEFVKRYPNLFAGRVVCTYVTELLPDITPLEKKYGWEFIPVENVGLDVGGWFTAIRYLETHDPPDLITKCHDKGNLAWADSLLKPLDAAVPPHPNVFMCSDAEHEPYKKCIDLHAYWMTRIAKCLDMKRGGEFVTGNMFTMNYAVALDFVKGLESIPLSRRGQFDPSAFYWMYTVTAAWSGKTPATRGWSGPEIEQNLEAFEEDMRRAYNPDRHYPNGMDYVCHAKSTGINGHNVRDAMFEHAIERTVLTYAAHRGLTVLYV